MAMRTKRLLAATMLVGAIGGSLRLAAEDTMEAETPAPRLVPLSVEGQLAPFNGATSWINSPPLTPAGLRGKVVLVDFWTLTCVNWLRTLPYVRAWAEKYKDEGLVVIGVHAPEFTFEKNIDDVARSVRDMRIDYPVAVDSDHAVWRAFRNSY